MKALVFVVSLLLGAVPACARGDSATIEAIWSRQVVQFVYRADDTAYSCSSLWQKVAGMLVYVGARSAAPVDGFRCENYAGTVRLQIALESPVEATMENLHAATDYNTKDMLVARVRGEQLPSAGEVTRFPATWTTLSLRDSGLQLTAADCDLVHQLREQILPKLSVRVIKAPAHCTSILARDGAPALRVRALLSAS